MYVLSNIPNTHKACYAMRHEASHHAESDMGQPTTRDNGRTRRADVLIHLRELLAVRRAHTHYLPEPNDNFFCVGLRVRHITPLHQSLYRVSLRAGVTPSQSLLPLSRFSIRDGGRSSWWATAGRLRLQGRGSGPRVQVEASPPSATRPHGSQLFLIFSFIRGDGWSCDSVVHLPRLSLRA